MVGGEASLANKFNSEVRREGEGIEKVTPRVGNFTYTRFKPQTVA